MGLVVVVVVMRTNQCTINLHNHKRNNQLGPIGALSRGPLVKSEFFFFCVFPRYLCNEDSSVDPTLILPYSAPGLFIARSIFREMLSVFSNVVLLRHVTSRHVLWQSIYSATRGHPMGTTYHHGWICFCLYSFCLYSWLMREGSWHLSTLYIRFLQLQQRFVVCFPLIVWFGRKL